MRKKEVVLSKGTPKSVFRLALCLMNTLFLKPLINSKETLGANPARSR